MPNSRRRCLLMCFAHPDDESFFAAGTARKYAEAGAEVVLCCATRGERGSVGDPPVATIETLPQVREQELRAAAAVIGVTNLVLLPYADQQLMNASPDEVRQSIVQLIRRHKANVVMTFDPGGANQHPDHVAISRFTTDAVAAAADHRWYPAADPPHRVDRLVWVCPIVPWAETDRRRLAALPGVDFVIDVAPWRSAKAQALAAHRSQRAGVDRLFLRRKDRDAVLSTETFRLGTGKAPSRIPADDLFAV